MENNYFITFGADIGGMDAAKAIQPHLIELRSLLYQFCNKKYSLLDEFAPILRVDGEIDSWNFEGCEKLRLYKKQRYITLDIGMPKNKWQDKSPEDIRKYLIFYLEEALHLIVKKLKKEKMDIDENLLFANFIQVKNEYLNEN